MNLNEIANLLTLDNNTDKESLYSMQKNTELKFHECLINTLAAASQLFKINSLKIERKTHV